MHGGDAGAQGQRQQQRRDVTPPNDPGRITAQRLEVEEVDQVDGQLPAPRRHDGPHRRIADESVELVGPRLSRCARHTVPEQALSEHDIETSPTQPSDDEVDARLVLGAHRGRRCRHRDAVTGFQRGWINHVEARCHAHSLPDERVARCAIFEPAE